MQAAELADGQREKKRKKRKIGKGGFVRGGFPQGPQHTKNNMRSELTTCSEFTSEHIGNHH